MSILACCSSGEGPAGLGGGAALTGSFPFTIGFFFVELDAAAALCFKVTPTVGFEAWPISTLGDIWLFWRLVSGLACRLGGFDGLESIDLAVDAGILGRTASLPFECATTGLLDPDAWFVFSLGATAGSRPASLKLVL